MLFVFCFSISFYSEMEATLSFPGCQSKTIISFWGSFGQDHLSSPYENVGEESSSMGLDVSQSSRIAPVWLYKVFVTKSVQGSKNMVQTQNTLIRILHCYL